MCELGRGTCLAEKSASNGIPTQYRLLYTVPRLRPPPKTWVAASAVQAATATSATRHSRPPVPRGTRHLISHCAHHRYGPRRAHKHSFDPDPAAGMTTAAALAGHMQLDWQRRAALQRSPLAGVAGAAGVGLTAASPCRVVCEYRQQHQNFTGMLTTMYCRRSRQLSETYV